MKKLPMCRVCLAENVCMFNVVNRNLRELYEKLTDNPFVTEDSRPALACFFCCTKLKQCYQFQRKCLEAEELFAQMMNEDYEKIPLLNQDYPEFCCGLIQKPIEHISIVDVSQTESVTIKEEFQAVCEILDDVIEPKKEHQSDAVSSIETTRSKHAPFLIFEEDIPSQHSDSGSQDDQPLKEFKVDWEEQEISRNKWRGSDAQPVSSIETTRSKHAPFLIFEEDIPSKHSESDSEDDQPLMEFKVDGEEQEVSRNKRRASDAQPVSSIETTLNKHAPFLIFEEDIPSKHSESDSEDDQPLMEFKVDGEEHEVSRNKRRASDAQQLQLDNVDNSYPDVQDTPASHAESDSEDVPIETEVEDEQESTGAPVAKKPKLGTRRPKPRDTISAEQKKNESRQLSCVAEIIMKCNPSTKTQDGVCGSINNTALNTSFRYNSNRYNIECKISNKVIDGDKIKRYRRVCANKKRFECDICQRSFNQKHNLVIHTRTHTGEKPFKCDTCQLSFIQKHNLVTHIRIHTGEKPFNCDICQRSFSHNSNLVRHTRTHTGEKPFNCDICQRSFSRKCYLISHIRIHNQGRN